MKEIQAEMVRELEEELVRMKRDYELFEEIAPPDVPRRDFVKWCYDAWDRQNEMAQNPGETGSEYVARLIRETHEEESHE